MKIHTVKTGESLSSIAKMHGTEEEMIRRDNGLLSDALTVGEELLILTPTRTYEPRKYESADGISMRFGISKSELCAANPMPAANGSDFGIMALRYPERPYGSAATNGYFYRGCSIEKLKCMLPYLTYITLAAAVADESGIRLIFDPKEALNAVRGTGIIPLIKIFDKRETGSLYNTEKNEKLASELIYFAKEHGFFGICLDFSDCEVSEGAACAFLIELKKMMMGSDLILITETDFSTPQGISDYSDGCTLSQNIGKSFRESVEKEAKRYADEAESAKAFLELPLFAIADGEYFPVTDAMDMARRSGAQLDFDEETKLLSFNHKRHGEIKMPSLSYIKALLDLSRKESFMGISFDIGKVPLPFILLFNSLCKTVKNTTVRAKEGCSRE